MVVSSGAEYDPAFSRLQSLSSVFGTSRVHAAWPVIGRLRLPSREMTSTPAKKESVKTVQPQRARVRRLRCLENDNVCNSRWDCLAPAGTAWEKREIDGPSVSAACIDCKEAAEACGDSIRRLYAAAHWVHLARRVLGARLLLSVNCLEPWWRGVVT